jgi:diguanylate cyclase (GGDEF)-like protein
MRIYDPGIDASPADDAPCAAPAEALQLMPAVHEGPGQTLSASARQEEQMLYSWNLAERSFRFGETPPAWFGIKPDTLLVSEEDWLALIYRDDREMFLDMRASFLQKPTPFALTYRIVAPNGKAHRVTQKGMPYPGNDAEATIVGVLEAEETAVAPAAANNNDAPEAEAEPAKTAEDEAIFDYSLRFVRKLRLAIEHARNAKKPGALLILSINNLAMIIHAYGHDTSEQAMRELQGVIQVGLPEGAQVERIHRDQFAVIVPDCRREATEQVARQLQDAIRAYGAQSSLGALHIMHTIGSVDFPGSAASAVEAIDRAYMALNSAYEGHYRSYIASQDDMQASRQQLGLANHLRKAIHENRLRLAFQPVVESKTGRIAHYEALLRIIGDDGKIISAGPLIPVAEKMNLIDMVDHLVLDMVVKELRASPNVTLALNVSNLTTDSRDWLKQVTNYLRENPDIAGRMIVEITETAAQRDLRQTSYFVASMQALGCRVALDDFGSGYTSFRQLKTLSVDMVKIDGMFIRDLVSNADNRFFVKTLLDFTHGFGLEAVAEYVEQGETAKMLMDMGVHYMQGYYFGKPENYRSWLNQGEYKKG